MEKPRKATHSPSRLSFFTAQRFSSILVSGEVFPLFLSSDCWCRGSVRRKPEPLLR